MGKSHLKSSQTEDGHLTVGVEGLRQAHEIFAGAKQTWKRTASFAVHAPLERINLAKDIVKLDPLKIEIRKPGASDRGDDSGVATEFAWDRTIAMQKWMIDNAVATLSRIPLAVNVGHSFTVLDWAEGYRFRDVSERVVTHTNRFGSQIWVGEVLRDNYVCPVGDDIRVISLNWSTSGGSNSGVGAKLAHEVYNISLSDHNIGSNVLDFREVYGDPPKLTIDSMKFQRRMMLGQLSTVSR